MARRRPRAQKAQPTLQSPALQPQALQRQVPQPQPVPSVAAPWDPAGAKGCWVDVVARAIPRFAGAAAPLQPHVHAQTAGPPLPPHAYCPTSSPPQRRGFYASVSATRAGTPFSSAKPTGRGSHRDWSKCWGAQPPMLPNANDMHGSLGSLMISTAGDLKQQAPAAPTPPSASLLSQAPHQLQCLTCPAPFKTNLSHRLNVSSASTAPTAATAPTVFTASVVSTSAISTLHLNSLGVAASRVQPHIPLIIIFLRCQLALQRAAWPPLPQPPAIKLSSSLPMVNPDTQTHRHLNSREQL